MTAGASQLHFRSVPCAIFLRGSNDERFSLLVDDLDADKVGMILRDSKKGLARLVVNERALWLNARNVWYVEDRPYAGDASVSKTDDETSTVDAETSTVSELEGRVGGRYQERDREVDPERAYERIMDATRRLRTAWQDGSGDLEDALYKLKVGCEVFSNALASSRGTSFRHPLPEDHRR